MWCRTILTAVAISYVICVLLLNGLQKDDLDANTVDKLRRHNVNIDDMNNEQLRQECLLNSYSDTGNVTQKNETTEGQNKALEESTTIISDNKDLTDYLKTGIGVPENIVDKNILQSGIDNKTDGLINQIQTLKNNLDTNANAIHDLGNVTKIEENNGLQIEYLQNQPTLQSVMNFWTKLTHNTKKVVTKVATTPLAPIIVEEKSVSTAKVDTSHNNGYVHSREMEYISRILAEYMASQTVPTTTQRITTKNIYNGFIAKRIEDYVKRSPVEEKPNSLLPKDIEQLLNNNLKTVNNFTRMIQVSNPKKDYKQSLNDKFEMVNNFTQNDMRSRNVDNIYSISDETKNMPYNLMYHANEQKKDNIQDTVHQRPVNYNYMIADINREPYKVTYDNNQLLKLNIDDKSFNQQTLTEKYNPINYLDFLLQNGRDYKMKGGPIPNSETTTETIKLLINEDHEQRDKGDTFNPYRIFQYHLPYFNNSGYKNLDRNQNVAIYNYQFKDDPTNTRGWEPIRNYRMINKQSQVGQANNIETDQQPNFKIDNEKFSDSAIVKNFELAKNFGMNDQFITAPANISDSKRIKTFNFITKFNGMPTDINYSEKMHDVNKEQFNANTAQIRKWKNNMDMDNDQFKDMLPSIKKLKQYQYSGTNNNRENSSTELNKSEQIQDIVIHRHPANDIFKDMVDFTNITNRNQVSIKNNYQFNVEPTDVREVELIPNLDYFDNQLKPMPVIRSKYKQIRDFKNVPANIENSKPNQSFVINSEQLTAITDRAKNFEQFKNSEMNLIEPQAIPANVIADIAEKVRQIVLKDIRKDVPDTTVKTSTTTTTAVPTSRITTSVSTKSTVTTTEKPTTLHKEIKEANHVIQKLMEMFNEFKAMKEAVKSTTEVPLKTTLKYNTSTRQKMPVQTFSPAKAAFNPYIMKAPSINDKQFQMSPYSPKMVPVPISSGPNPPKGPAPQYVPQRNFQHRNEYKSAAITIQTNADEIEPLAIQISEPMKLMNQHIIVTTKSPSEILKEQHERESKKRIDEKYLGPTDVRKRKEKHQLHLDLEKIVRIPNIANNHEYSDTYSYKNTFNKNIEKPRYNHEFNENVPDNHIENLSHSESSRYAWSSTRPGTSNYPGSSSYTGSSSYPGTSSQPVNSRHPWSSSHPRISSNPQSLNHQRGMSHTWNRSHIDNLNHPRVSSHSGGSIYPGGMSHSGSINSHLSRQEGKHHAGSYGYNDPEGPYPRHETKFHEQLERIENWPRNGWKRHRAVSIEKNCCEEIPARQQMPLTKVKQRTRFDDTHFTNFLKSQQKVTDMLEKILATNIKSNGPQSVETP